MQNLSLVLVRHAIKAIDIYSLDCCDLFIYVCEMDPCTCCLLLVFNHKIQNVLVCVKSLSNK